MGDRPLRLQCLSGIYGLTPDFRSTKPKVTGSNPVGRVGEAGEIACTRVRLERTGFHHFGDIERELPGRRARQRQRRRLGNLAAQRGDIFTLKA